MLSRVVSEVGKEWGIPAERIRTKTKVWAFAEARIAVQRIVGIITGLGPVDVSLILGISHSTVVCSRKRVDALMSTDPVYRGRVERVIQSFERFPRFRMAILRWRISRLDEADVMFVHNVVQTISIPEHKPWADRIRAGRCAIVRTAGGGVEVFEP